MLPSLAPALVQGPSLEIALSYAPYQTVSRGGRRAARTVAASYHIPFETCLDETDPNAYCEQRFEQEMKAVASSSVSLKAPIFHQPHADFKEDFLADIKNPDFTVLGYVGHAELGVPGTTNATSSVGICFNSSLVGMLADCLIQQAAVPPGAIPPPLYTWQLVEKLQLSPRITFVGSCNFTTVFDTFWDISSNPNRALVVPVYNSAHPDVDLAIAAQFWVKVVGGVGSSPGLVGGAKLVDAVNAANLWVLTVPNPGGNPANRWEQWAVIGNQNAKLLQ